MSTGARIAAAALILVVAILQVSIVYRIELGGVTPDLLVLVVASIALLTGSIHGACYGFLAGLAIATFAAAPLGPHALVGALIGYTVGRVGEVIVTDDHPIPPLAAGIFATLVMHVGAPLVEFLVSPRGGRVDGLWGQAALVAIISAVLAVPVYLAVRRALTLAHQLLPSREGASA